jgi:hypothetical protein
VTRRCAVCGTPVDDTEETWYFPAGAADQVAEATRRGDRVALQGLGQGVVSQTDDHLVLGVAHCGCAAVADLYLQRVRPRHGDSKTLARARTVAWSG